MFSFLYPIVRPLLFRMDPERAHYLTLALLARCERNPVLRGLLPGPEVLEPVELLGLRFPTPVGLAAGLDKDGLCIDGLAALGFGFIEVGTVTPRPQTGNPQPRLFRLPRYEALINRMGFNNAGVDALVERIRKTRYDGVLGVNIGKNADTPNENALGDYLNCLRKVYPHASYVTVNLSSPNTSGLRELQFGDAFRDLAVRLRAEQIALSHVHGRHVPVLIKIAPDLDEAGVRTIAGVALDVGIDGLIATNTTISREAVQSDPQAAEQGGLSGRPLSGPSTAVLATLCQELDGRIPVIASGGVMDAESARAKFSAGARLIQVYTGLIYRGPALIREIHDAVRSVPELSAALSEPVDATEDVRDAVASEPETLTTDDRDEVPNEKNPQQRALI